MSEERRQQIKASTERVSANENTTPNPVPRKTMPKRNGIAKDQVL